MIIDVVFGTFAAYSLVRFEYTGRKTIMMGVLAAYCIPPIMLMVPLYRIIAGMGLKDSYLGIIIGHLTVTFPFSVWLLMSFFRKIPKVLDEAALVDGADLCAGGFAAVHFRHLKHRNYGVHSFVE